MDFADISKLAATECAVTLIQSMVITQEPLRLQSGTVARCAASCLIRPQVGDRVLCAIPGNGEIASILMVIERFEPAQPLVMESSSALEMRFPQMSVLSERIEVIAEHVEVNVGVLKRIADRVDETVEYLSQTIGTFFMRAKRSIRRVDELDETRAGHLRLESPALVEVHGAVTAVSAEKLIRLQGKQIHMG